MDSVALIFNQSNLPVECPHLLDKLSTLLLTAAATEYQDSEAKSVQPLTESAEI
jgi:hypothetical protein